MKPEMIELTEAKIIELMREEWDQRLLQLEKSLNAFTKTPEGEKMVLGVGTRVKHRGSQLLYTIVAVDYKKDRIIIRPSDATGPEHDSSITSDEFEGQEPEYELD